MSGDGDATPRGDRSLVLVTADLFLGSRIRGLAEQAGFVVTTVPGFSRPLDSITGSSRAHVVLDLTVPGLDRERLADWLGEAVSTRTLAYAPHVRVDLLKTARAVGIGTVIVRSQLDDELPRWLTSVD